jgi:hypothetical protein
MGVDVLDILATILGVWFTLRKLDAQSRQPEAFPHVPKADFLAWREREVSIYRVAVWACFVKVMVDLGFTYLVAPGQDARLVRAVGATIDLSWLAVIVVTLVRSTASRAQRRRLGIVLGGASMMPPEEEDDDSKREE